MSFLCTFSEPVVETRSGRLRGFMMDGIYQFRGVKYAEAERFQPPVPVEPWEGIRDATSYAYNCLTVNSPGLGGAQRLMLGEPAQKHENDFVNFVKPMDLPAGRRMIV